VSRVYLVRHAKAKNRLRWTEPDHLRPLTNEGRRQADALRSLYGAERFSRLVSSPYARCVQTLEPLAAAERLTIELAGELSEGAPARGALALVRSLAADGPAVACTHGDVLLDTLAELRALGVPLDGPLESRKASTWILEIDGRGVRRGRYLEAPRKTSER
jgi:8-oxo-dGTP diphosphatase